MPYTEQDPLLPRDKPSPEIKGSRPQSITGDDDDDELEDSRNVCFEAPTAAGREKRLSNDLMAVVLGLCSLLILTMLIIPDGLIDDIFNHGWPFGHQEPKTIDERVNRILTETPLIGMSISRTFG